MVKLLAINGSPSMKKGDTAKLLAPFLEGAREAGAEVELYYANQIKPRDCAGQMTCWYGRPGECHIQDGMQEIYPRLREADILVLATPIYIPLPGSMQNFINRLCPLIKPRLEFDGGRTRARFHDDVRIKKIVLVSTGGWWEIENFDPLIRIMEELAIDTCIEFSGAILRPHAMMMDTNEEKREEINQALTRAGSELIKEGTISNDALAIISQPLISEEELRNIYNAHLEKAEGRGRR